MKRFDFEEHIEELEKQLERAQADFERRGRDEDQTLIEELNGKLTAEREKAYKNLTGWQKVMISRHEQRPYTLDYIENITEGFIELHGDRNVKDDKAMVGGFAKLNGQTVMMIGHQKGHNTKTRKERNFGMPNPEGYRKALRLMRLADKFNKPIITLIDTPGAAPGIEAEERGQGEAIAFNLREMSMLRVPVICIVIGEGASGGALGIGVGNRVLMMENAWYSVIAPESCSSILWKSWDYKQQAAEALSLTADKMLKNKLIDGIIPEPPGGAHNDPQTAYQNVTQAIVDHLCDLDGLSADELIEDRINKFSAMGVFSEDGGIELVSA